MLNFVLSILLYISCIYSYNPDNIPTKQDLLLPPFKVGKTASQEAA